MSDYPHEWKKSTLGHGEMQCVYCLATNREIAVCGDLNHCAEREKVHTKRQPGGSEFTVHIKEAREVFSILNLMSEKHKFCLEIGYVFPTVPAQEAFEGLQISGWIRLIDVSPVSAAPGKMFRVFFCVKTAVDWYNMNKYRFQKEG